MGVTYVANPMITFFNCHEGWFDVSSIYGKIGDSLGIVYCWVYHIIASPNVLLKSRAQLGHSGHMGLHCTGS